MNHSNFSRRTVIARGALLSAVGLSVAAQATADVVVKDGGHSKNIDLILTFCRAGAARDLEGQMRFIPENGIYHNMPDAPIVGRENIRALLSGYLTSSDATEIIVNDIAESAAGIVLTQRVDRFRIKGGKWIDCPVMGAARIENGKIAEWRDYYDNQYLAKQMS